MLKQMPYRIPTGKENVIPRTPLSAHRVKSQMPFLTTKAQARPPSFGWGQPRRDAGDDDEADEKPAANGNYNQAFAILDKLSNYEQISYH